MIDGETRHELLMTVKEVLNNIVRHAEATEIEFQLRVSDEILEIAITDNGRVFETTFDNGGRGLRNLRTRLLKIGGNCRIESRVKAGTTVRICLPIPGRV